ncbi:MAG: alpha/beta fold hydrolase [Chloroflexi bacterium]|nr:alpha/beta fold hydrolase [Chloroflexota bacterium]
MTANAIVAANKSPAAERVPEIDPALLDPFTGTYALADGRLVFVGPLLGANSVFVYYDFGTGRVGALYPSAPNVFTAGPALFVPEPTDAALAFRRHGSGMVGIEWRAPDQDPIPGARLPLRGEEVTFRNGDVTLAGTLLLPEGAGPHPAVVMIHGSGKQTRGGVRLWADYFVRRGIAALVYDKRGADASSRAGGSFEDLAHDALAGLACIRARPAIDPRRVGLWGGSQGGWIAPLGAVLAPDHVAFVVMMAGPGVSIPEQNVQNVEHSMRAAGCSAEAIAAAVEWMRAFNHLWATGEGFEQVRDGHARLRERGWADFVGPSVEKPPSHAGLRIGRFDMAYEPVPMLERVMWPVLALFGEHDTAVPPEQNAPPVQAALRRAGNPASTVRIVPRANHLGLVATDDGRLATCTHFIPEYLKTAADWILQLPSN